MDHVDCLTGPTSLAFTLDGYRIFGGAENSIYVWDAHRPGLFTTKIMTCPSRRSKEGIKGKSPPLALSCHHTTSTIVVNMALFRCRHHLHHGCIGKWCRHCGGWLVQRWHWSLWHSRHLLVSLHRHHQLKQSRAWRHRSDPGPFFKRWSAALCWTATIQWYFGLGFKEHLSACASYCEKVHDEPKTLLWFGFDRNAVGHW